MAVRFHPHARQRMAERGASEAEVLAAVREGERLRLTMAGRAFVGISSLSGSGEVGSTG